MHKTAHLRKGGKGCLSLKFFKLYILSSGDHPFSKGTVKVVNKSKLFFWKKVCRRMGCVWKDILTNKTKFKQKNPNT